MANQDSERKDRHVLVKFMNYGSAFDSDSKNRLISILNKICYPNRDNSGRPLRFSNKNYSYISELDLNQGDIILVDANGVPTIAGVESVDDNLPVLKCKRVLAKLEFSQIKEESSYDSYSKNELIASIFKSFSKEDIEEMIASAIKKAGAKKLYLNSQSREELPPDMGSE